MRVLVDECLPRALTRLLPGHACKTVQEMGWSGKSNGELLSLAQGKFDVLVTIDQALGRERNLANFDMAVLVLRARSNQIEDLSPAIPAALAALRSIRPGQILWVGD